MGVLAPPLDSSGAGRLRELSDPQGTCPLISPDWRRGTTRDRGSRRCSCHSTRNHHHLRSHIMELSTHGMGLLMRQGGSHRAVDCQGMCRRENSSYTPNTHTLTAPLEPPQHGGREQPAWRTPPQVWEPRQSLEGVGRDVKEAGSSSGHPQGSDGSRGRPLLLPPDPASPCSSTWSGPLDWVTSYYNWSVRVLGEGDEAPV